MYAATPWPPKPSVDQVRLCFSRPCTSPPWLPQAFYLNQPIKIHVQHDRRRISASSASKANLVDCGRKLSLPSIIENNSITIVSLFSHTKRSIVWCKKIGSWIRYAQKAYSYASCSGRPSIINKLKKTEARAAVAKGFSSRSTHVDMQPNPSSFMPALNARLRMIDKVRHFDFWLPMLSCTVQSSRPILVQSQPRRLIRVLHRDRHVWGIEAQPIGVAS